MGHLLDKFLRNTVICWNSTHSISLRANCLVGLLDGGADALCQSSKFTNLSFLDCRLIVNEFVLDRLLSFLSVSLADSLTVFLTDFFRSLVLVTGDICIRKGAVSEEPLSTRDLSSVY